MLFTHLSDFYLYSKRKQKLEFSKIPNRCMEAGEEDANHEEIPEAPRIGTQRVKKVVPYVAPPSPAPPRRMPTFFNMKAILLGNAGTGKTNIIEHLAHGRFDPSRVATQKYDKIEMCVELGTSNLIIHVTLWDTVGQETFKSSLPSMLYHDCHLCIIVYDITDRSTLEGARWWFKELQRVAPPCMTEYPFSNVILVGNKLDLDHLREVSAEEGKELAHELGICFFAEQSSVPRNALNNFDNMYISCVGNTVSHAAQVELRATRNKQHVFDITASPQKSPAQQLKVRGGEHYLVDKNKHHIYEDGSPEDKCEC